MLTGGSLHEHACGEVVSVMGRRLVWRGLPPHYRSLPLEIESVYLAASPEGTGPAELQGRVFWQSGGAVITISLTALHQRDITSESV